MSFYVVFLLVWLFFRTNASFESSKRNPPDSPIKQLLDKVPFFSSSKFYIFTDILLHGGQYFGLRILDVHPVLWELSKIRIAL